MGISLFRGTRGLSIILILSVICWNIYILFYTLNIEPIELNQVSFVVPHRVNIPRADIEETSSTDECIVFSKLSTESVHVEWNKGEANSTIALFMKQQLQVPIDYIKIYEGQSRHFDIDNLDSGASYSFILRLLNSNESDCVKDLTMLEAPNLVRNPSFEKVGDPQWLDLLYTNHYPNAQYWQPFSLGYFLAGEVTVFEPKAHTGKNSLVMKIDPHEDYTWDNNGAYQYILLNQSLSMITPFTISAWSYGMNVTGFKDENYGILVDFKFQDGTHLYNQMFSFDPKRDRIWQHKCIIVEPIKPVYSIGLVVVFRGPHSGTAYFDDVMTWPRRGLPSEEQSKSICQRSYAKSYPNGENVEHPFYLEAEHKPRANDVSILTFLTVDRMERLIQMSTAYQGAISAVIYVRDKEKELPLLHSVRESHTDVKEFVDFHVVFDDHGDFPPNKLRNTAIKYCRTELGLMLDVDFIPSVNMSTSLNTILKKFSLPQPKTVYVVVAFEANTAPKTKKDVKSMMTKRKIKAVHIDKTFHSHGPTDHTRWLYVDTPYEVEYDLFYEPYFIVPTRTILPFDERFRGYGHDKESLSYELDKAGYKFVVLPDVFITHINHNVADWKPETAWLRIEKSWYDYVAELSFKYPNFIWRDTWLSRKLREEGQL